MSNQGLEVNNVNMFTITQGSLHCRSTVINDVSSEI